MIDLQGLRSSPSFNAAAEPRLAFVHFGFKSTLRQQGEEWRATFASRYPPLGLLALMRHVRHDIEMDRIQRRPSMRYFDEDAYLHDDQMHDEVVDWLAGTSYPFLLMSVFTSSLERIARFLSRVDPARICIVVGGPHIATAPVFSAAHLCVRGEGGRALRHIVDHLLSPAFGKGPDAKGICYRDGGELVIQKPAFDDLIVTLPSPAFDYTVCPVPPRPHWVRALGCSQQIYVSTQSCGSRCTFCSTYLIHGKFLSRPAELMDQDFEFIQRHCGYDGIEFHDDDLLQHEELGKVLAILQRRGLRWSCNARASMIVQGLSERLHAAGCRSVYLGLESMSQSVLDYYNKDCTVAENESAVQRLDAANIAVTAGFVIGAPSQTVSDILADLDRFLDLPIYFLAPSILTPDVGTVEFRRARKNAVPIRLLEADERGLEIRLRPDAFGTQLPYGIPTVAKHVTKTELNELYQLAQIEFLLRPHQARRLFAQTPGSHHELVSLWFNYIEEMAARLIDTARLAPVTRRLRASVHRWHRERGLVSDIVGSPGRTAT